MLELVAIGPQSHERWRRSVPPHGKLLIGRAPSAGWAVPWDKRISREHVEIVAEDGGVRVRRLPDSRNPVFFGGKMLDEFVVGVGEHFVIGATAFHVADGSVRVSESSPSPREEHKFRPGDLRRIQFRNADHRLEVLSRLPAVISQSSSDEEFYIRVVDLLLAGIPHADAAAIVARRDAPVSGSPAPGSARSREGAPPPFALRAAPPPPPSPTRGEGATPPPPPPSPTRGEGATPPPPPPSPTTGEGATARAEGVAARGEGATARGEGATAKGEGMLKGERVRVLQWDRRREAIGRFQPSQRLILAALERGESVLHVWSEQGTQDPAFTISENLDWAFCTPVPGEACRGWGLYVAGTFAASRLLDLPTVSSAADLKGDLRFAELVAELTGALRQVRHLEGQRAVLSQFLSPSVLDALVGPDSDRALEPRESDVTVLFCDLRGFSREAEHWRDDLPGLLERVSEALGVMTQHIREHGGTIGDFAGDAAMGFWGWPVAAPDGPLRACLAALDIRAEFERAARQKGRLADFQMGIGIAHGRAVAGKIGTADHAEVTVFGPVVNLASRLEGMTKQLRVPILLDDATANYVREHLPMERGRCRRLCRVRPYGMETSLMVSELLPPAGEASLLSNSQVADFEEAVEALLGGRWSEALEHLQRVPAKDRAKDFLTMFIVRHDREPPPNWDGTIPMPSK